MVNTYDSKFPLSPKLDKVTVVSFDKLINTYKSYQNVYCTSSDELWWFLCVLSSFIFAQEERNVKRHINRHFTIVYLLGVTRLP